MSRRKLAKSHKADAFPAGWMEELKSIYKDLEARPLERQCIGRSDCCQFAVTGETPQVTLPEAEFLMQGIRAAGRKTVPPSVDGACPALNPHTLRCIAYAHRPLACRTHFCAAAGGRYPRAHVIDLIHRLEELDARMGGDGARALPNALG